MTNGGGHPPKEDASQEARKPETKPQAGKSEAAKAKKLAETRSGVTR